MFVLLVIVISIIRIISIKCKNPWNQPGFSKINTPCWVSGGLQSRMDKLKPYGQPAETYSYPNGPTITWEKKKTSSGNFIILNILLDYILNCFSVINLTGILNFYN